MIIHFRCSKTYSKDDLFIFIVIWRMIQELWISRRIYSYSPEIHTSPTTICSTNMKRILLMHTIFYLSFVYYGEYFFTVHLIWLIWSISLILFENDNYRRILFPIHQNDHYFCLIWIWGNFLFSIYFFFSNSYGRRRVWLHHLHIESAWSGINKKVVANPRYAFSV